MTMKTLNYCVIGTAGHIDHGKTSLVRALTGIDTDRLPEEKKRGLTIDLGFAHLDLDTKEGRVRAAIVDVPGHERFIRNMLAGTTGIDFVLFVVAADDGVMPQTREHLDIVRLLGIRKGIFAVTKKDLVSDERVAEVKTGVESLLKNTVLEGSPIIPVSTVTGDGIEALKDLIRQNIGIGGRAGEDGFFRLPIDRSFTIKGFGTVVTGTVASGSIRKGDEAVCFPGGERVKVRGMQSLYREVDTASAGQRAALNISGVSHNEIRRGFTLASPELKDIALLKNLSLDCSFEFVEGAKVKKGQLLKVHHLTDESLATIRFQNKKGSAACGKVFGRLKLRKPLLALRGDRFILRDPALNSTVGGGEVAWPYFSKDLMPRLEDIERPPHGDGLEDGLNKALNNRAGADIASLCLMLNVKRDALAPALKDTGLYISGGYVLNSKKVGEIKGRALEAIREFHSLRPMEPGIREEELFKGLKNLLSAPSNDRTGIFREIIDGLIGDNGIKREGSIIRLSAYRPEARGEDVKIEEAIRRLFSKGFVPPLPEEVAKLPHGKKDIERVFSYMQRNGFIVKLKEGSFISTDALKISKERLLTHMKAKGSIKAAEFRDLLGCGRKLAIEILEYFDKEKVTLRAGDSRTLR
ncbi:MAG: selenocysteine-specific translation elongation factor [Deltaproteobacteria bacterium]|nr:selenocysteine-specific translation elongation factor [Deltaproteobacteria bacterium]